VTQEIDGPTAAPSGSEPIAQRLGGFIYGTLVALAVVITGAKAYPDSAGRIVVLVVVTSVTLWLAHVYAHSVAKSVADKEHLSLAEVRNIATRERSIIEAALAPVAALLLAVVGLISTSAAVWAALGLGLAVLATQGLTIARVERFGAFATCVVVAANLALGLILIGLKLLLPH
jgi:hypothetical protein